MNEQIQFRENRSEALFRLLDRSRNIDVLKGRKLEEVFSDEKSIRNFIEEVNPIEFIGILNGVNGILRGKEKMDWSMDGDGVEISGALQPSEYIPPRQEDKESILGELVVTAKQMSREGRSLEDIALLLGITINATHAYADGNGRTSRFVYFLTKEGYSAKSKAELAKALGEEGRGAVNPSSSFIRNEVEDRLLYAPLEDTEKNPLRITNVFPDLISSEFIFAEGIPEAAKKEFLAINRRDGSYMKIAILEHVYRNGNAEEYTKEFPAEQDGAVPEIFRGAHRVLILSRLTPTLSTPDIQNIINRYWQLKREFVEKIMDCIANPDKEENSVEIQGQRTKFIDRLKAEMKEDQESF